MPINDAFDALQAMLIREIRRNGRLPFCVCMSRAAWFELLRALANRDLVMYDGAIRSKRFAGVMIGMME